MDMPCQMGANIMICAAVSTDGPLIGPYNTERLISFLGELYGRVVPGEERDAVGKHVLLYGTPWHSLLLCCHRVPVAIINISTYCAIYVHDLNHFW